MIHLHNMGFDVEYVLKKNGKVKDVFSQNEEIKVEGRINVEDSAPNGIVTRTHEQPMKSWVCNGIDYMLNSGGGGNLLINYFPKPGAGTANDGIIVGCGSTAVNVSNVALEARMSHSDTNGLYFLSGVYDQMPTLNGNNVEIKLSRQFRNNTAGSINISECGISNNRLLIRDVFTSGVALPSGYIRKITYTLSFPISTSKSWLSQFFALFDCVLSASNKTIKDTNNINQTITTNSYFGLNQIRYLANNDVGGLQVGAGTSNVAWDTDYKLAAQIAHGTGTGQLQYSACADAPRYVAPYTSGSSRIVEYWRDFTNASGAPITVNEAGLVFNPVNPNANIMLARWLTGGIVVNNGEILTVKFKVKVTA